MRTVAPQKPLAEITLRKYEPVGNADNYELSRRFCLSVGLLNPGDSRDIIVDITYLLFFYHRPLSALEIKDRIETLREKHARPMRGIALSNVLRQLRRLKEIGIIQKHADTYCLHERESMSAIVERSLFEHRVKNIMARVSEYAAEIDRRRGAPHEHDEP